MPRFPALSPANPTSSTAATRSRITAEAVSPKPIARPWAAAAHGELQPGLACQLHAARDVGSRCWWSGKVRIANWVPSVGQTDAGGRPAGALADQDSSGGSRPYRAAQRYGASLPQERSEGTSPAVRSRPFLRCR